MALQFRKLNLFMETSQPGERWLTHEQYRKQAISLVIDAMATLDLGPPSTEKEPGVNDPTYRVSAFCYGAQIACRPLTDMYVASESKDLQSTLENTYRLSFHFSAGVPLIQSMYQARIARLLREKYGEQTIAAVAGQAVFNPASAVPPSNHVNDKVMQRASNRAPAIWQFYMDILSSQDKLKELQPTD